MPSSANARTISSRTPSLANVGLSAVMLGRRSLSLSILVASTRARVRQSYGRGPCGEVAGRLRARTFLRQRLVTFAHFRATAYTHDSWPGLPGGRCARRRLELGQEFDAACGLPRADQVRRVGR